MNRTGILAIYLACVVAAVWASIAGVTYMDNFDFEARYRDIHECDPFYWYPLHLPEECMEMYDKVIRSGISTINTGPVRLVLPKDRLPITYRSDEYDDYYENEYKRGPSSKNKFRKATLLESMYQSIQDDINVKPSKGEVKMSNVGPVAVYQQPVSGLTQKMIQDLVGIKRRKGGGRNSNLKKKIKKLFRKKNTFRIRTKKGYDLVVFKDGLNKTSDVG